MILEFRDKRHAADFFGMISDHIRTENSNQATKRGRTFKFKKFHLQRRTGTGFKHDEIEIRWGGKNV